MKKDEKENLELIKSSINSIEETIQNIEKLEGSSSSIEKQVTDIRKLSFKMKKTLNEEVLNLSKLL